VVDIVISLCLCICDFETFCAIGDHRKTQFQDIARIDTVKYENISLRSLI
jgi:hypothetical protein